MLKECRKCNKIKPISDFGNHKNGKNGLQSWCKSCNVSFVSDYLKTKKGLVSLMYSNQKRSSKERNNFPPLYSKNELIDWCFNQELFHKLYDDWKNIGFNTSKVPSCDRINDYLGYSFENIQLTTWEENKNKGHVDRKNGINNKENKAVIATHISTGEKYEFHSQHEAERITGVANTHISKCCRSKGRSAGGYVWTFKITN